MKRKLTSRFWAIFALLFSVASVSLAQSTQEVEMADSLRSSGKIYVVVVCIAIIFVGLFAYIFSIDRKLTKLEK